MLVEAQFDEFPSKPEAGVANHKYNKVTLHGNDFQALE